MKTQQGLVLLPVTLALAIVGALAYGMTREGAMTASGVDAQYDIDRARYLAEAGVNLLKWRNEQAGCANTLGFTGPVTAVDGGTITAGSITWKKPKLAMTVTATTSRGSVNTIALTTDTGPVVHDIANKVETTIGAQGGSDTFIRSSPAIVLSGLSYLETTEGNAHGLIKFGLTGVLATAMIEEATLRLYLTSIASTQAGTLGVHRLLRDWPMLMSWTNGWTTPGGDFTATPSATIPNVLATATTYTTRIDSLVQTMIATPATNYGLVLKPTGLVTARFASFEAATNGPQLFLRYYPACK